MKKSVKAFMYYQKTWQSELKILVDIYRSTNLLEEVKWNRPCYSLKGKNVIGLVAFNTNYIL
ncbi:DUF1801 domain-containing protein [Membranihabitans marinus]|uniref:DUF1801 domain-containing protein n=1 Tax=Membranihabitans marinus TaxID=1227546 RepID=UPI001F24D16C|nr:DUF1801 domain-containing protein [Membranihabitans marinus]